MGKIYTRKFMLVIGALLLCIVLALLIRLLFSSRTIRMTLNPIEVEVGEPVHYSDSTRNAKKMALGVRQRRQVKQAKRGIYFYGAWTLSDTPQNR